MKTYDYGLLDFHKELHWVNGSYDPQNPPGSCSRTTTSTTAA